MVPLNPNPDIAASQLRGVDVVNAGRSIANMLVAMCPRGQGIFPIVGEILATLTAQVPDREASRVMAAVLDGAQERRKAIRADVLGSTLQSVTPEGNG